MKLKHVGMIVVSVLAMSSAAVSAAEGDESVTTTVNGGVIHFKGEVVNAACAIDSESMNQTVELGQVRSSRLAKAGDLSSAVGFNIKLNDCDTNVSSNAAVAFLGTTVTSNDDTLALQSSAAGSAQNVGIQILDRTVKNIRQKNMCRTTAHAHHFRIVWPTHQLSLMLVSNICHSPFRKFMLAEWLAAMFLLICGKKE